MFAPSSYSERLDEAAVELAYVSVQISGLREAPLAPLARVRFLSRVNHSVPAQIVRVLEALPALSAGVRLLAGVRALVPLERVHAGEGLAARRAGRDGAIGRELGANAVFLLEVRAEVELEHMSAWEDFAAERTYANLLPARREEDPAGCGDVRRRQVVLVLALAVPEMMLRTHMQHILLLHQVIVRREQRSRGLVFGEKASEPCHHRTPGDIPKALALWAHRITVLLL